MSRSLTHSLPAKVAGIFLIVILVAVSALSGLDMAMAYSYGIYDRSVTSYYETNQCYSEVINDLHCIHYMLEDGITQLDGYYGNLSACNLRFAGYNTKTGQYLSNDAQMQLAMQQIVLSMQLANGEIQPQYPTDQYMLIEISPDPDPQVAFSEDGRALRQVFQWDIDDNLFIAGVVDPMISRDSYYRQSRLFDFVYSTRILAPILFAVCALAALADLIFLCCAAGHRHGKDEVVPNLQDRIPLDLYLFGMFWLGFGCLLLITELTYNMDLFCAVAIAGLSVCFFLLCLATLLTLCTRWKLGSWWRNTLIYWCCSLFFRACRRLLRGLRSLWYSIRMTWRVALVLVALSILNHILFMLGGGWYDGSALLLHLCLNAFILLVVCSVARQMLLLKKAGKALANGDFEQGVDTTHLRGDLRTHGEHLNSLGRGLSIAVDQKMRSERLKTELITNVSHDIKTPLTSIINYVDLLQKNPSPEEQSAYLEVLDRQAKRLKKLTEDLMEASKASTGNLACHLAPTNLREILDQSLGEYEDRLKAAGLEPVVTLSEDDISVIADGRLLWRVLDNLLNNACKYAQSGTRLYLDVRVWEDRAVLAVKNISRQQLNLSPDELMERFVRGDSSRNTEGSGLGLNIAKSLVELQNGAFSLSIDGDLFKATIALPRSLSTPEI